MRELLLVYLELNLALTINGLTKNKLKEDPATIITVSLMTALLGTLLCGYVWYEENRRKRRKKVVVRS